MKWLALAVALLGAERFTYVANANPNDNTPKPNNSNVERDFKATKKVAQSQTISKEKVDTQAKTKQKGKTNVSSRVVTSQKDLKQANPSEAIASAKKSLQDKFTTASVDNTFYVPLNENLVLDPAFVTDRESIAVLENLFDTLVHVNSDGGYDMLAAESYEVSSNGKRWLFKLREDARWSDDTPVTAYDFVYAWQRLVDPAIKSPNRYILTNANILNAADVASGTKPLDQLGVVALNDHELLIVLDKPTPWLLSVLSSAATIPLKYVPPSETEKSYTDLPTNGAYRFAPDANNDFLLVKNEYYWDNKRVSINNIRSYGNKSEVNSDRTPRNIIYLNAHNKERLEEQYPNQISTIIYPESKFLIMNMLDRSMGKIEVRRALNLLIDRNRLVEEVSATAVPTTVFAPPVLEAKKIPQDSSLLTEINKNKQLALKLLKKAGYNENNPLVLRYVYNLDNRKPQNFTFHKSVTDMIMENSSNIVRIEYVGLNNEEFFKALKDGDYQLTALSWRSDYNHASAFYNMLQSDGGDNFAHYSSFEYDYLLSEAYKTKETAKREELYAQANNILQQDLPIVPLYWQADRVITDPRLKNFASNGSSLVKNMYFDVGSKTQVASNNHRTTSASGQSTGESTSFFVANEPARTRLKSTAVKLSATASSQNKEVQ